MLTTELHNRLNLVRDVPQSVIKGIKLMWNKMTAQGNKPYLLQSKASLLEEIDGNCDTHWPPAVFHHLASGGVFFVNTYTIKQAEKWWAEKTGEQIDLRSTSEKTLVGFEINWQHPLFADPDIAWTEESEQLKEASTFLLNNTYSNGYGRRLIVRSLEHYHQLFDAVLGVRKS